MTKKQLSKTINRLADRYWADLVRKLLSAFEDIYQDPTNTKYVETLYRWMQDKVVETTGSLDALRAVAIWNDLADDEYVHFVLAQIHKFFVIELIRNCLFHDLASGVKADFIAKVEEEAA